MTRAEALRPFVLFGALVIVVAAGLWLLDEFVWPCGEIECGFFTAALVNINELKRCIRLCSLGKIEA